MTMTSNYVHKTCLICNTRFFFSKSTHDETVSKSRELKSTFSTICNVSSDYSNQYFSEPVPFCTKCSNSLSKIEKLQTRLSALKSELEKIIKTSIQDVLKSTLLCTSSSDAFYEFKHHVVESKEFRNT